MPTMMPLTWQAVQRKQQVWEAGHQMVEESASKLCAPASMSYRWAVHGTIFGRHGAVCGRQRMASKPQAPVCHPSGRRTSTYVTLSAAPWLQLWGCWWPKQLGMSMASNGLMLLRGGTWSGNWWAAAGALKQLAGQQRKESLAPAQLQAAGAQHAPTRWQRSSRPAEQRAQGREGGRGWLTQGGAGAGLG